MQKIETNFKQGLFWNREEVHFQEAFGGQEKGLIQIYPEVQYQKIVGFGGAFTEASGFCLKQINKLLANTILDDYFLERGLNYSLCRAPIGSTDFSLSSYSYLENSDILSFSVKRDEKYIIPMIKNALQKNPDLKILASPWSPPAFMKNNKSLILGGKLLKDYAKLYAEYLTQYILEYQKRGIFVDYITIQNEPNAVQAWESCLYSAEEEAIFVKEFLYPKFIEKGIQTEILAWDHNKQELFTRSKTVFSEAPKAISGMAMHWYSGDYFEEIELAKSQYPNKLFFHTEGCTGYSHFRSEDEVKNAEIYAHDLMGDLNAGIHGFIDWNLVLDYQGGPNHKRNYCNAPIMINRRNTGYIKNLTYYYIGHFSQWIKPGARRIGFSKYTEDIEMTAFQNPDDTLIIVLLNRNGQSREYLLQYKGEVYHDTLDGHAIVTLFL